MVLASPENGWGDLLPDSMLQCADPQCRGWEWHLRSCLIRHERIGDDFPSTNSLGVGWQVKIGDFGLKETYHRGENRGSYTWDAPVKTPADLTKLHFRSIEIDRPASERLLAKARDLLGDILSVQRRGGHWWTCGLTWSLIQLRGLNQVMLDLYDNPGMLHELMSFLRDDMLNLITTLEREGVLSLNNAADDMVGSGSLGGTDELPAVGFGGAVRLADMWGLAESQEFVGVGPGQFDEFALRYQLPIINRFGLAYYGCCEPLDRTFDLVLAGIPRLRTVSVSPWCDRPLAAQKLGGRYVYAWKPNPALICGAGQVDWAEVERLARETAAIAREHACPLAMVMKDTHTFQGDGTRITRWCELAQRAAQA